MPMFTAPQRPLAPCLAILSLLAGCSAKSAKDSGEIDDSNTAGQNDGGASGGSATSGQGSNGEDPDPDRDKKVCEDLDHDGAKAGPGCTGITDCDDTNPDRKPGGDEVCGDQLDNNCSAAVDEGCPCDRGATRLCSSHGDPLSFTIAMHCQAGVQRCGDSTWEAECAGEVGPIAEECNNLDDDCDGEIDESLRNAIGQCLSDHPEELVEDCGPTAEGNGVDDDGNGQIDETCSCVVADFDPDLPRTGQPCYGGPRPTLGVGACHGGKHDCQADGTWTTCEGQVLPTDEICGNDVDEDCNGIYDETCPRCIATGAEVCNGKDDDCDGVVDEGVLNACGGCGVVALTETCGNGRDDDCNGKVDDKCSCTEGDTQACYAGPTENAGVSVCKLGTQACSGGEFPEWMACVGSVLPDVERCGDDGVGNGVDDDCDGLTDEGCGCTEGAVRPCGVSAGECAPGQQTCTEGKWTSCQNETGPVVETCNQKDDNCDGLTDEGLLNACGTCGETCYDESFNPVDEGEKDDGTVGIAPDDPQNPSGKGGITLSKTSFIPPYLWAANHERDTVSKFNTDTNTEEAIYWVGDNPSRTAVDLDGNVWIGGRDDGRLTKILWDTTSCKDRNTDSIVSTSTRHPTTGVPILVNGAGDPLADECVVYSDIPNATRLSIRGIAAGPDGKIWLGYTGGGIQSIDPYTFELGPFITTTSGLPVWQANTTTGVQEDTGLRNGNGGGVYGLVVDSKGHLYTSSYNRNTLARYDTINGAWVAMYKNIGCGSYGIAVDGKDRIWLGGWSQCGGVGMFDPATLKHHTFAVPDSVPDFPAHASQHAVNMPANGATAGKDRWKTTGVGVEPKTGNVWMSFFNAGYTGRLVVDESNLANSQLIFIGSVRQDADITKTLTGVGSDLRGVGFDHLGYAWTLGLGSDRVFKIDPATNARSIDGPTGFPLGTAANNNQSAKHYTYSDFTGSTALSFTAPRGFWRATFDTTFVDAQVDAVVIEAYVPEKTTVGMRIRTVDMAGLPVTDWIPAEVSGEPQYTPYPVGDTANHTTHSFPMTPPLVGSRYEVELLMTSSDANVRPVVHGVTLDWQRP